MKALCNSFASLATFSSPSSPMTQRQSRIKDRGAGSHSHSRELIKPIYTGGRKDLSSLSAPITPSLPSMPLWHMSTDQESWLRKMVLSVVGSETFESVSLGAIASAALHDVFNCVFFLFFFFNFAGVACKGRPDYGACDLLARMELNKISRARAQHNMTSSRF
uniref:Uncharacterized protein n=1 Tax=Rhipicephalus pulchellus TaxID=72859 RepID=L7LVD9_RHIPC